MYICKYTYIYTHMCIYIQMYRDVYIYMMYIDIYLYIYICIYVYIYTYTCLCNIYAYIFHSDTTLIQRQHNIVADFIEPIWTCRWAWTHKSPQLCRCVFLGASLEPKPTMASLQDCKFHIPVMTPAAFWAILFTRWMMTRSLTVGWKQGLGFKQMQDALHKWVQPPLFNVVTSNICQIFSI